MRKPLISVIVIFRNEEKYIGKCIESILNQNYRDFELVMVNDCSTDRSAAIVKSFKDERIRYFENSFHKGIAGSRNRGLKEAKGRFIFFTDADCIVDSSWLDEGMKYLKKGCAGVEGRTIYPLKYPSISHKVVQNLKGNSWPTCNIAYQGDIIRKIGGFNNKLGNLGEDLDLALRVQKYSPIIFNKKMLVKHNVKKWSFKKLLESHKNNGKTIVLIYKHHHYTRRKLHRILFVLYPIHLLVIIFPFLVIYKCFINKIRNINDLEILAGFYVGYLVERYYIWKTAFEEGVFLV